jgi:hypothetical protein
MRPSYYSGRPAHYYDIQGKHLWQIHKGIEEEFGKDAALSFVKMVASLRSTAGSIFIESLTNLAVAEWKWNDTMAGSLVPADGENPVGTMVGLMHVMNAADDADERDKEVSYSCRKDFLKKLLPKEEFEHWEKQNTKFVS